LRKENAMTKPVRGRQARAPEIVRWEVVLKLGPQITVWRAEDIHELIAKGSA
jgi:hypothetical protein